MRELFLGPVGAQNLVTTEQVSGVGPALKLVGIAGEPDADFGFVRVARRAHARACGHIRPAAGQVREHVLESVKGVFYAILGFEPAYVDLANPGVGGMERADDHVIQVLAPAREEIRKFAAVDCHNF
jgi:hypothetical protein